MVVVGADGVGCKRGGKNELGHELVLGYGHMGHLIRLDHTGLRSRVGASWHLWATQGDVSRLRAPARARSTER